MSETHNPAISVVIASIVGAPFVDECLDSLQLQAGKCGAEVIVVRLAHAYQPPEGHALILYPISFALISQTRKITKKLSAVERKHFLDIMEDHFGGFLGENNFSDIFQPFI